MPVRSGLAGEFRMSCDIAVRPVNPNACARVQLPRRSSMSLNPRTLADWSVQR